MLPRATLIHCRRTSIDIAISIHRTYFNPYTSFPTGGDALVAAIRAVERLTAHWRRVLPPERFVEVRFVEVDYEQLVRDPERHQLCRGLAEAQADTRPHESGNFVTQSRCFDLAYTSRARLMVAPTGIE